MNELTKDQVAELKAALAGLEKELSPQQLTDLVRFLLSCRVASPNHAVPTP